ncbi:DNA mismatch repair protein MutT [Bifidobacterium gallicum DSM 20093 = LMG 11596]|uniref:DNA mismatch repair protein MutT n=1 Tax=Bifidobacterium gallicum DSM 20093 = LMG 11596 TaxID=561180 RepID=A0A087AMK3_9BIFI|nr:DNA mismatch repair protein MutT [Bifidobacterium gallicum DSM 20093 = LMG 11596]
MWRLRAGAAGAGAGGAAGAGAGGAAGGAGSAAVASATPAAGSPGVGDVEVCLVHRPKYDDWSWPKGKLDANESHRHAAVREIGEETGCHVALGPYLTDVEYPVCNEGKRTRKTRCSNSSHQIKQVSYWMASTLDRTQAERMSEAFGPVHRADIGEIDEVAWMPVEQARKTLTHSTDRDVLAVFVDRLEEGAAQAATLLLVRHAKAESRKSWDGTEASRPITPKGSAAAYALDRELACYNPTVLFTSPWRRCVQTVRMLAWQTGFTPEGIDELTEDAFADSPDESWRAFRGVIDGMWEHAGSTLICMHRPVIGGMFDRMRDLCVRKSLAKQLIAKSPYMPTGSALALTFVPGASAGAGSGTSARGPQGPRIIDIQKVQPIVY